jgi:hypothetical protein
MNQSDESEQILLRVVQGDPTDEELAALVAVVAARRAAASGADTTPVRRSGWTDRSRAMRGIHHHGPNGWRSAALPR